jgi:chemotaxis protein histidine kinase CheA
MGEEKLFLRPLDERLGKVSYIRAMALRGDGSPTLVLDMNDLFETAELHAVPESS